MAWILTYEGNLINSPESIRTAVEACRDNNLNAVIPVVRRRGRAYYDSKIEPHFKPYSEQERSFDSLAEFLKHAHNTSEGKRRLEVHGWVVVSPVWMEETSPPAGHIINIHPEWRTFHFDPHWREDRNPQKWLDPGVPAVEEYLVSICTELVKNYELDGLNLDYIRYREGGFGYNPVALKRFQQRFKRIDHPAPSDEQWNQWRREQVTNLVRRIYVETKKIRPEIKLSICGIVWGLPERGFEHTSAYTDVAQDALSWAKEGIIDINLPMNYKAEAKPEQKKSFRDWLKLLIANRADTKLVCGLGAYMNSISDTIQQIVDARQSGADGVCLFRLEVNNKDRKPWQEQLQVLKKEVFAMPVPVPDIQPFNKRNYGILCGKVTLDGTPMDSLLLTLVGDNATSFTTTSSGTGYYAFVKIPAGNYLIKATAEGRNFAEKVTITNGTIITLDITLTKQHLGEIKK